jgi:hypothetical protein
MGEEMWMNLPDSVISNDFYTIAYFCRWSPLINCMSEHSCFIPFMIGLSSFYVIVKFFKFIVDM